ncbi:MAG: phage virion morphogenesis protein, partial [Deltaproteobacteria bacterium]|nr:phage virion morphogenesis protein [Deltaproteobacteria bacterium]
MGGITLTIDIANDDVRKLAKAIAERGKTLTPVFKAFGEYMLMQTECRFSGEHDPAGRPWTKLSARRLAEKKGPKILTERSRLRKSIVYKAGTHTLRIGTNVVYAAVHQLGMDGTVTVRPHARKVKSRNL